jgi:hypothetical protein
MPCIFKPLMGDEEEEGAPASAGGAAGAAVLPALLMWPRTRQHLMKAHTSLWQPWNTHEYRDARETARHAITAANGASGAARAMGCIFAARAA